MHDLDLAPISKWKMQIKSELLNITADQIVPRTVLSSKETRTFFARGATRLKDDKIKNVSSSKAKIRLSFAHEKKKERKRSYLSANLTSISQRLSRFQFYWYGTIYPR